MRVSDLWDYRGCATGVRSFSPLDGLRGYMAWWVVIGHAIRLCGLESSLPALAVQGYHGVSVFIILSGFVITHLLLEKKEAYLPYLTRRAFRLFPIYWFCLALAILIFPAYNEVYSGAWLQRVDMRLARQAETEANFATHVALHIPLLQSMVPDTLLPYSSTSLLSPAWSLSLEWQFYLVAPFVVAALVAPGWSRWLAVVALLAIVLLFKKVLPLQWQYDAALPLALHFFLVGILSRVFLPLLARARVVWWLIPLGVVAYLTLPHALRYPALIWSFFLAATCFELAAAQGRTGAAAGVRRAIAWLTSNPFVRRVGETSYSTYLVHIPVFVLCGIVGAWITGAWTQQVAFVSTAVALVLLVPISFVLYNLIERRFVQLGAAVVKRRPLGTPA